MATALVRQGISHDTSTSTEDTHRQSATPLRSSDPSGMSTVLTLTSRSMECVWVFHPIAQGRVEVFVRGVRSPKGVQAHGPHKAQSCESYMRILPAEVIG